MVAGEINKVKTKRKRDADKPQTRVKRRVGRPKKSNPKPKPITKPKPKPKKKLVKRILSKDEYNKRMTYLRIRITNTLDEKEQEKYKKMINKLNNSVEII